MRHRMMAEERALWELEKKADGRTSNHGTVFLQAKSLD